MAGEELAGRSFDMDLGSLVPRLSYLEGGKARLYLKGHGFVVDEVIDVDIAAVRPSVFVVSWIEASGNYIVQVQDHERNVVHNRARLSHGTVLSLEGVIRPLT